MTILSNEEIQQNLQARDAEDFEINSPSKGSIVIPITEKHVALAVNYFKSNWAPGKRFDFRQLSRLSACDPSRPAFDFTADGIAEGQKLSPAQIKLLFDLWYAEYVSRQS